MKKTIYFFASTMFVSGTILTGCKSSSGDKIENAEENSLEARQDLTKVEMDTMDIYNFRRETNEKIAANERRIEELKTNTENEKKETREARKNRITELEQKNRDLQKRLDEYREEGKEAWESFKREFNHDMDELGKALKDLTVDNKK